MRFKYLPLIAMISRVVADLASINSSITNMQTAASQLATIINDPARIQNNTLFVVNYSKNLRESIDKAYDGVAQDSTTLSESDGATLTDSMESFVISVEGAALVYTIALYEAQYVDKSQAVSAEFSQLRVSMGKFCDALMGKLPADVVPEIQEFEDSVDTTLREAESYFKI
ncbi:uncharacterized protein EAF01_004951 [Botrytis porri]|uniref:Uncharacterized protein n=1 Tax=Botrytis porri TaxID=87229 RepID=A0A4Z1KHG0_9HELO|nr:uncharacterized protein EAF01_004951 [Botrytis porri]KAF7907364.1 hypothetical protein EAF01_004951 [Botrytis porri]TGO80877.1 hypothetical protein BPOR_1586g00010 [Botrytis porri]